MLRVPATVFRSVVRPAQLALRRAMSTVVDRRLGICTTDEAVAAALGRDVAVFRRTWRALGWTGVARLLRRLDPQPGDVLLDVGCGAGRIVCAAARRPFDRVIGLEIDPEFAALARRNVDALRTPHRPAEIVTGDATTYEVPDDVTTVFLYNPFGGEILDRTIDRIVASARRSPRRVRIAYANPKEEGRLVERTDLQLVDRMRLGWRPGGAWARSQLVLTFEVSLPSA